MRSLVVLCVLENMKNEVNAHHHLTEPVNQCPCGSGYSTSHQNVPVADAPEETKSAPLRKEVPDLAGGFLERTLQAQ
jgi:hypothetical protein